MIAVGLLFVRILCDYFKSRQRLEAEILVQCLKRPLLVNISTVSFQPLRSVLQVPRELHNRQLCLMLLKVHLFGCI